MPFQNIVVPVSADVPVTEPLTEGGEPGRSTRRLDTFGIRLQWSKDAEYVQLASCKMVPGHPGVYMPEEKHLREEALWATLDRHRINELINHLRTARDQAFGKDA